MFAIDSLGPWQPNARLPRVSFEQPWRTFRDSLVFLSPPHRAAAMLKIGRACEVTRISLPDGDYG